jgi:hypothetical protein
MAAQCLNNKQRWTRRFNTVLLAPALESAQTKHRHHCLRPLEEVSLLGLGAAPQASGYQCHCVAKIDTSVWSIERRKQGRVPVTPCTYVGNESILRQVPIRSME